MLAIHLQNYEMFEFFRPLVESGDLAIEVAGSLRNGKRVFVLGKIKADPVEIRKNDPVEQYLLIANSHDGTFAVRLGFTPIRVVCANTLALAMNNADSKLFRVLHRAGVSEGVKALGEVIDLSRQEFIATTEQYKFLASKPIVEADLENYIRTVFKIDNKERKNKTLSTVLKLFEGGRGAYEAGQTWWAAYNAVNEYLNYFQGRTQDKRLDNLWFGQQQVVNKKALNIAVKMAA